MNAQINSQSLKQAVSDAISIIESESTDDCGDLYTHVAIGYTEMGSGRKAWLTHPLTDNEDDRVQSLGFDVFCGHIVNSLGDFEPKPNFAGMSLVEIDSSSPEDDDE